MSQSGRETMTGAEFKSIRKRLGLSLDAFAIELGYEGNPNGNKKTILRFESGQRPVPLPVAKLAFMLSTCGIPTWPAHLEGSPVTGDGS